MTMQAEVQNKKSQSYFFVFHPPKKLRGHLTGNFAYVALQSHDWLLPGYEFSRASNNQSQALHGSL